MSSYLKRLMKFIKTFFEYRSRKHQNKIRMYLHTDSDSNTILGLDNIATVIISLEIPKLKKLGMDKKKLINSFPSPPPPIQSLPHYKELQKLPTKMWKSYEYAMRHSNHVEHENYSLNNKDVHDLWNEMIDYIDIYAQLYQKLSHNNLYIAVTMIHFACDLHLVQHIQDIANEIGNHLKSTSLDFGEI